MLLQDKDITTVHAQNHGRYITNNHVLVGTFSISTIISISNCKIRKYMTLIFVNILNRWDKEMLKITNN